MQETRNPFNPSSPFSGRNPRAVPKCLRWQREGCPEIFFWVRPTLGTPSGDITPDGLVYAGLGKRGAWMVVEIDETRTPRPDSLERERKSPLPVLRVTPDMLARRDFLECLVAGLRMLLERAA